MRIGLLSLKNSRICAYALDGPASSCLTCGHSAIRESTLRFKSGKQRIVSYFGRATINLAPCGNVTVLGVLQTGQVTLTFVSGIWAEGSVMLETLKVFTQFLQS